jgi:hypothetical protein
MLHCLWFATLLWLPLCRSTLLFQQIKFSCIAAATQAALKNLIAAKLIQVQTESEAPQQVGLLKAGRQGAGQAGKGAAPASQLAKSRFVTTQMGRAVYDSALPSHTAMELYGRWVL